MAKITPQSIANLKALFQDNEKALGANFSQLIDFFNDNKVTDNGDGTFTVGAITVDASKLYNLINNSSPNILPLDNEFTGKNTFDIAPINKANGKPYITADSVPPVDLSNYPTKDQLATKADTSAIDPSVMVKRTLTANDDILALDPGTYWVWGANKTPKNFPTSVVPWGRVVVKMMSPDGLPNGTNVDNKIVEVFDTVGKQIINVYQGNPVTWSGWRVPNANTMASKTDVTTAVSTATANMVDSSKPTNFTAGLQSGGVDVATAADLKSVEDQAWRPIISNSYSGLCMMKYNADTETMSLSGTIFPKTYSIEGSRVAVIIPMPEGFSMGENTDSKTTIWTNVNTIVQKFAGVVADLKYESDGIHIIFDKIYSHYSDPKMFIILDDFFAYSTANPQSNNLINFKVTKN